MTGGQGYAHALAHGYLPSMIVMGGLCVAAALVTALFVSDARTAHRCVPRTPDGGCAVPVLASVPTPAPASASARS